MKIDLFSLLVTEMTSENLLAEAIAALSQAQDRFRMISRFIEREEYADPMNRAGVAIDCGFYADEVTAFLERINASRAN